MPRVIGIDPGTVSIDLCGLEDGRVFVDRTFSTTAALADPAGFVATLEDAGPLDLVIGPSGYGLPLMHARDATDEDLRVAFLAAPGEAGGVAGLTTLARALARSSLPVMLTPGVIHFASVPEHRKVNRVDMGTADKVAATALAIDAQARRRGCTPADVSLVLLELGGAFSAAVAVAGGRIVDGMGGTAGPLGLRAVGALDGEVAFLAGTVAKSLLFQGGATSVAEWNGDPATTEWIAHPSTVREQVALDALIESAAKAATALALSVPAVDEFVLSGRLARVPAVHEGIARLLKRWGPVRVLPGIASTAKEGAQGAAILADGLMGGAHRGLVETLGVRDARGSVLDHLYVISRAAARRRLGLA